MSRRPRFLVRATDDHVAQTAAWRASGERREKVKRKRQ